MLDTILEQLKQIVKSRLFPVAIIYFLLFSVLINRLFYLQIVKGEVYEEEGEQTTEKPLTIKSTRGNIFDRNGKLLAYNELSYAVTITNTGELSTNEEKNRMIHNLIQIIEKNGSSISYDFGLKLDKTGTAQFSIDGTGLLRFRKDVYANETLKEEQLNATAEEMFQYLRYDVSSNGPKFDISEEYTKEEALKIMTIRYALFLNRERQYIPSVIAKDVDEVIVAAIKESNAELPGVEILQETNRVYKDSEYFAHMLGYTGMVTSENLEDFKATAKGGEVYYDLTDQIGKTGLEKSYEDYLRGTKGSKTVVLNENKRAIDTKDIVDPVAGNDLYLTIDADLQKACYKILEKKIAGILLSKINNGTDVGTKGVSANDIKTPIYDVYYALIRNNIIDITKFDDKNATELEKKVYKKYLKKWDEVFIQLKQLLSYKNTKTNKDVTEEEKEYLEYIYSMLKKKEIILVNIVDETDETFLKFVNDSISLSSFLQYALAQNWIDLTKLNIGDEFYSTEELYEKLIEYIITLLQDDSSFNKKLYHSLVYSYKLSGKEICLLLFDQGVLKYDEEEIKSLKKGSVSAYQFLTKKMEELEITPGQLGLEPCSGSIVVTDVKTGEVRALVSYPSYDNNKLANTIDSAYYSKLMDEDNPAVPSMNRPTQQIKAPGSTFKMVSAIASLEEGVTTLNQKIRDKVSFTEIPLAPKCWKSSGHGNVDIVRAIEVSCNYYFYNVGYQMSLDKKEQYNDAKGLKTLKKYASMFGFDAKSGIELAEAEPHISEEDAVRSSIGQGNHAYTPAQISRYVSTIANSGTCYNLTIIDKVKDMEGNVVVNKKPDIYNKIDIKQSTWDAVHEGMYKVVNGPESSIKKLFNKLDVKVAGKTGTAQENPKQHPNHAVFVSYAPFDNPDISVTVVIPNGHTSSNAAEVARDVYRYYFEKENRKSILNEKVTKPELEGRAYGD